MLLQSETVYFTGKTILLVTGQMMVLPSLSETVYPYSCQVQLQSNIQSLDLIFMVALTFILHPTFHNIK
jgi:hypothetical protein